MNRIVFRRLLKETVIILTVYLFIGLIYIAYTLAAKVKLYETGGNNINEKELDITYQTAYVYDAGTLDNDLTNFLSCYQEPMKTDEFTEEMKQKYKEIEKYFSSSRERVSFSYEDLYTGLHISYNEKQTYFAASAIKAPVVLYVYKLYTDGKIDLNTKLTYQQQHYVGGSGYIQFQPVGSTYSIKELSRRAIVDSDNIAYTMLSYHVANKGVKDYWKNLGADYFWSGNIWGSITSHDGTIYMKELYKFINEKPEVKEELLNYHFNSVARLISLDNNNIKIAHKSGWNSAAIHDTAIVLDNHPYVLSIMSLKGNGNFTPFFKKASNLINEFHNMYWNEKSSYCYNKTFSDVNN